MALAALIGAYQEVADGDALRGTLPIAGHVLVEHQARQAVQAGAQTVILLVERVPAPLTAAIDRLRRSGVTVEVARSVADAADRVHPEERLLVMADGLVAEQRLLEKLAGASAPAVLAVPDEPGYAAFERIDASARWGGLLLTDGTRLRRTAAMLGEWDLMSTLLRRTLQEDARRIEAGSGISLVDRPAAVETIRGSLIDATRGHARSWPERFLFAPMEELAVPPLLRSGVDPLSIRAVGIAVTLVGALAMLAGWRALGLLGITIALPMEAVATRLARLRLDPVRAIDPALLGARAAKLGWLAAFAYTLSRTDGWGVWVLAIGLGAGLLALAWERRIAAARGLAPPVPAWLADEQSVVLVILIFALPGRWSAGLAAAALYALGSFFFVQRRELRGAARMLDAV